MLEEIRNEKRVVRCSRRRQDEIETFIHDEIEKISAEFPDDHQLNRILKRFQNHMRRCLGDGDGLADANGDGDGDGEDLVEMLKALLFKVKQETVNIDEESKKMAAEYKVGKPMRDQHIEG